MEVEGEENIQNQIQKIFQRDVEDLDIFMSLIITDQQNLRTTQNYIPQIN